MQAQLRATPRDFDRLPVLQVWRDMQMRGYPSRWRDMQPRPRFYDYFLLRM